MLLATIKRYRVASGLRAVATSDGAIVSAERGCFRLDRATANRFLREVVPSLLDGAPTGSASLDWVDEIGAELEQAGLIASDAPEPSRHPAASPPPRLAVVMQASTPLIRDLTASLARRRIPTTASQYDDHVVVADLCDLDLQAADAAARALHAMSPYTVAIWRNGSELVVGPFSGPNHPVCWRCCRMRLQDPPSASNAAPGIDAANLLTEVLEHVHRLPALYPEGCALIHNGVTASLHAVVALPWCDICGGGTRLPVRPTSRSAVIPPQWHCIADDRTGLVQQIRIFDSNGSEAPVIPHCASAVIAGAAVGTSRRPNLVGEGKGGTPADAVMGAIGEGLERYAASQWPTNALIRASFDSVNDHAFDPRALTLYEAWQHRQAGFPFAPFDPAQTISWAPGLWLDDNSPALLPALAVYLDFPAGSPEYFVPATSSGLAAGGGFEDAALRALYELIERDALMLAWLCRLPGRLISPVGCEPLVAQCLRETEACGAVLELRLLDFDTGHPTVVCMGFGDGAAWPGLTIGMAAHADIDVALRRAVFEHAHYGAYMRRLLHEGRDQDVRTPGDVCSALDHGLFYLDPCRAKFIDPLRADPRPAISIGDLRNQYRTQATLQACVEKLRSVGIRTAAVDLTPPDVALASVRVVRAFGTHMQPIHFGFGLERLSSSRLQSYRSGPLQTLPHPIA